MTGPGAAGFATRVLIARVILLVAEVLTWAMVIDALLTFIPTIDRRNPFVKLLRSITEPIYRPLRRVIAPVRMGDAAIDLSPLIAIIGIRIIANIIASVIL
jgi:YggT family protein